MRLGERTSWIEIRLAAYVGQNSNYPVAHHIQAGDAGTDATANSRLISERRLCLGAEGFSLANHIGFLSRHPSAALY